MWLAPDPIVARIGGEGVTLSPSLRAATRIAHKHRDFTIVLRGVLEGHISIIADLITEGSGQPANADRLFAEIAKSGVRNVLAGVQDALTEFVLALIGYDPDAPAKPADSSGSSIPFTEYHNQLFGIATGWLGWSPAQAWAATPAEIEAAYKGRYGMFKAVYGGGDDAGTTDQSNRYTPEMLEQIDKQGFDPAFDRNGLRSLKHKNKVK